MSNVEPPEPPSSRGGGEPPLPEEPPPPPPPRPEDRTGSPPPPPPSTAPAEATRRRGRLGVIIAAVAVVIGVPVAVAVVATISPDSEDEAPGSVAPEELPPAEESEPEPPDPDELSGGDAVLARLLLDVDESEQAMMAFQDRVDAVIREGAGEPAELVAEVRDAAESSGTALSEVRPELVRPLEDNRFEDVRVAYLAHHDAWADYLDAVAEDPSVLGGGAEDSRWELSINLSAEVFAQELREAVDDEDVDSSVRAYAQEILARGFERPDMVPDV